MEHEFLPCLPIRPEFRGGIVAGGEAVVGGADHAVVEVEGGGSNFSVGILGAEAGDMGEGHGVFRDADAGFGHGRNSKF